MFNLDINVSLIAFINLFANVMAPLIIVGLWAFGFGCLAKALVVVSLRLNDVIWEEEMTVEYASWLAEMAELEDFDPSEFETEEQDCILAEFGTEDLTKWEPENKGWIAEVTLVLHQCDAETGWDSFFELAA